MSAPKKSRSEPSPRRRALAPLLVLGALPWIALNGCSAPEDDAPPRPNLVLIVVDTLRADRLGCYGWEEPLTPNVDALAREGVLFEDLHCHVPQTLPSFCSLLTGTVPLTHGVRTNGIFSLPGSAVTLAETLQAAGYRTGAFVAGFPLDARFGVDQGFETYGDRMRTSRVHEDRPGGEPWLGHRVEAFETTADLITGDALRWLDGRDERPFFLMVHYFDPHHEYVPPAEHDRFAHPYSGEVRFVDEELGRLLARLDELGLEDDTLVAFTADHGECLGELDRLQHQALLFEAVLHVPLVLRLPGTLPAGARVTGLASTIDVMPTLLELCGVPAPATAEGTSLVPAVAAGKTAREEHYFESLYGMLELDAGVTRNGLLRPPWKLVRSVALDSESGLSAEALELFNLAQDPEELRNLATRRQPVADKLTEGLDAFLEAHPEGAAEVVSPDAGVVEKLKALGYF